MKQNNKPIFQSIFAHNWEKLPAIMHKHYANRPFCNDVVVAKGKMDIEFGWFVALLSPLLRILGVLVPYRGKNIPVTVRFLSNPDSSYFYLERTFYLSGKKPYVFFSKMQQINKDIVVEIMNLGIGWKHRFYYNGKKIILEHRGYVLSLFGKAIPLPIDLVLGKGYAEEEPIDDNNFRMKMNITHPIFGEIYRYQGEFCIDGETA